MTERASLSTNHPTGSGDAFVAKAATGTDETGTDQPAPRPSDHPGLAWQRCWWSDPCWEPHECRKTLKEALRAIFAGDLDEDDVAVLLDRFCSKASRSGIKALVTVAKTIRKRNNHVLPHERVPELDP